MRWGALAWMVAVGLGGVGCARSLPPAAATIEVPMATAASERASSRPEGAERAPTRYDPDGHSVGDHVEVKWKTSWWPAVLLERRGAGWLVHYVNYGDEWDELVTPDRVRSPQAEPGDTDSEDYVEP